MFLRLLLAFVGLAVLAAGLAFAARDAGAGPILLLAAVLALGPAWFFARTVVRPLRVVGDAADRIARGEYGERVHAGPWAECRELAARFNDLSEAVAGRVGGLEAERDQLRAALGGMAEGGIAVGAGQRVLFANAAAGGGPGVYPARGGGPAPLGAGPPPGPSPPGGRGPHA